MNIYKSLNEITEYIDKHLEDKISYEMLARMLGVNEYTMQRIFSMLTNISIAEYIRKRRLSQAGFDLYGKKQKIIDIAIKYQYSSPTTFARAFKQFHGINPSQINKKTKLKNYPKITFNESIKVTTELEYEIISLQEKDLYGLGVITNNKKIGKDAPKFFKQFSEKYQEKYGTVKYGLITYSKKHLECEKYYCLYEKKIEEFEHIKIPTSKWLKFTINSQDTKEIQEASHRFYQEFLPSCKYNLKEIPELEYYHNEITDFLVAIDEN